MIRLVLSDMDNTLVPFGSPHVSARTLGAVHALLDAGVLFGPATGRDCVEIERFFQGDEAGLMTGVFSNGKRVRANGRPVRTVLLDHDALVRIDRALRPEPGMFLVCYPEATDLTNPAYGVGVSREELAVWEPITKFTGTAVDAVPDEDFIAATIACSGGPERMDLAGLWRFQLDPMGFGKTAGSELYLARLTETIHLPGSTDEGAKGVKNTVSTSSPRSGVSAS